MIWVLALAQLSAPEPVSSHWLRPQDTPMKIMPENSVQAVRVGVTVTPHGKAQDCRVEVSSGNPQLDRHTCSVVQRRVRFRPATDFSGKRVFGIYRTSISWWVGDGYPPTTLELPDIQVTVSALPLKVRSPKAVRVRFAVDELGRPSSCGAEGKKDHPQLVAIACDRILKTHGARPAQTAAGVAVPSVQTATVLIRTN